MFSASRRKFLTARLIRFFTTPSRPTQQYQPTGTPIAINSTTTSNNPTAASRSHNKHTQDVFAPKEEVQNKFDEMLSRVRQMRQQYEESKPPVVRLSHEFAARNGASVDRFNAALRGPGGTADFLATQFPADADVLARAHKATTTMLTGSALSVDQELLTQVLRSIQNSSRTVRNKKVSRPRPIRPLWMSSAERHERYHERRSAEHKRARMARMESMRKSSDVFQEKDKRNNDRREQGFARTESADEDTSEDSHERKRVQLFIRQNIRELSQRSGATIESLADLYQKLNNRAATPLTILTEEMASLLMEELDYEPIAAPSIANQVLLRKQMDKELSDTLPVRAPVVCVMGHVDHGKTTLLDALRNTNVVAGEAGGITQRIAAFNVPMAGGKTATFLDTPGHAAFKTMRSRGASTVDLIVLVIGLDDGIMPQTIEAIRLAQSHNVPLIVALNKVDIAASEAPYIRRALGAMDVFVEEEGGSVPCIEISAKHGTNLDQLKLMIDAMAEVMNLRAPVDDFANAHVIESRIDKKHGPLVDVVVRRGHLKPGDHIVCGSSSGKVRALLNDRGERIERAGPSEPVSVLGLRDMDPQKLSGELVSVASDSDAAQLIDDRQETTQTLTAIAEQEIFEEKNLVQEMEREEKLGEEEEPHVKKRYTPRTRPLTGLTQEQKDEQDEKDRKTLTCLIHCDVSGSWEALRDYIDLLPSDEVQIKVIKTTLGDITQSDVDKARQMGYSIFGFNVNCPSRVMGIAEHHKVPIVVENVIYRLMDSLRDALSARLPVHDVEEVVGVAEVLKIYQLNAKSRKRADGDLAAGCSVKYGELLKKDVFYRLSRNKQPIWTGSIRSLRHFKDEKDRVQKGNECGVMLAEDGYTHVQVGDVLECVQRKQVRRVLDDSVARGADRDAPDWQKMGVSGPAPTMGSLQSRTTTTATRTPPREKTTDDDNEESTTQKRKMTQAS